MCVCVHSYVYVCVVYSNTFKMGDELMCDRYVFNISINDGGLGQSNVWDYVYRLKVWVWWFGGMVSMYIWRWRWWVTVCVWWECEIMGVCSIISLEIVEVGLLGWDCVVVVSYSTLIVSVGVSGWGVGASAYIERVHFSFREFEWEFQTKYNDTISFINFFIPYCYWRCWSSLLSQ